MSTSDLKFSLLLRAARSTLSLSLKDVAEQVDVSPVAVGKWENNDVLIKASIFSALQKFYKANGVIIELNDKDEPTLRITDEGVEQIGQNPKRPHIKSLKQIYEDEMSDKVTQSGDLEKIIAREVEREIKKDPELVKKILTGSAVGAGAIGLGAGVPMSAIISSMAAMYLGTKTIAEELAEEESKSSQNAQQDRDEDKKKT